MPTNDPQGTNPSDILSMIEGMKALGLLNQIGGHNILQLGDTSVNAQSGLQIPTPANRGVNAGELGFAPQGVVFTGGSPYPINNTGRNIQNSLFLLDQLLKSGMFGDLKGSRGKNQPPANNSVMKNQAPYDWLRALGIG